MRSPSLPLAFAALLLAALPAQAEEPAIDYSKLKNGLELIVVEKHTAPLVTIEVAVRTGSFTETPETNGLSHLYEHMFFKGNATLPTQQRYMERVSELGISFNGTTSTERVNYYITLPSRNFGPGMKFMADALLTLLFNMEEMKAEREVVTGEYDRNEAGPLHYMRKGMQKLMYGREAYRKNPLGERKVILTATQQTMRNFRNRFYVPNNACLLIVGDVNPTEVKVLAEQLFGPRAWPKGKDPHALPRKPLPRLSKTKVWIPTVKTQKKFDKVPVVVLDAQWPGPDVGRDERATFVADVWGTLCGLPHARFQRTFRDRSLADQVNLYYYTQREGGEINFRGIMRNGSKVFEVRDALLSEVAAMAEAGYWTEQDLALAKRNLRINRAYEAENGANLSHNLSFWWASSSVDYYKRYLKETDSVTMDELRAFVRNYLVGRPMVLGCFANERNVKGIGISEKSLMPKVAASAAAASAVEELKLENGARVLFRRAAGSAVTALQLFVDGGCLDLREEQQGIDKLLLSTILDGSKRTPRDELQAKLVALGARTGNDTNYDYSRLSVVAPRDNFDRSLGLVAECLRQPAFTPASVTQRRGQMLTALKSEKGDPDGYVVRVLNKVFFAKHPYRLRPDGTPDTVATLTPDHLRSRLRELLVSGRLLLVLVGDMDSKTARTVLEKHLGFIPRGEWNKRPVPSYTPSGLAASDKRDIPTTYVLGKCAAPAPGDADYPAASLALAHLNKRLWATLRTKHHITYAAAAGISRYRGNYGYIYVSTKFPTKAVKLIYEEIRKMQSDLVEPSVLKGLVTQQETRSYTSSESAVTHAEGLGHAELNGGSWRRYYETPLALGRVTPEDVRRAARRYIKGFSYGLIGPDRPSDEVLRGEAKNK